MSFIIHSVIIDKSVPFDDALNTFHNIINNNNKNFYRETKNTYRFRNYPKQKFNKTTFRTKKIRGQVAASGGAALVGRRPTQPISIVFGQLLPEYEYLANKEKLTGNGLFDFLKKGFTKSPLLAARDWSRDAGRKVKEVFGPSSKYNNVSTDTLNKYGDRTINNITIYRTPINQNINLFLNLFSLGKWEQAKAKYGYDKLFHLAMVCESQGKNIIIEKNEVVNISTEYKVNTLTETYPVSLGGLKLTIRELLENTRKRIGDKKFFTYDPYFENCQDFIINILTTFNLNTKFVVEFIKQPIGELINELPPYTHTLARFITDAGAIASRIIGKSKPPV
jgi:hypothetical protein